MGMLKTILGAFFIFVSLWCIRWGWALCFGAALWQGVFCHNTQNAWTFGGMGVVWVLAWLYTEIVILRDLRQVK